MSKIPSPCIDVCKHKMKGGHCIGCSMTKKQKSEWKGLDGKKRKRAFIERLLDLEVVEDVLLVGQIALHVPLGAVLAPAA
ncbi:MAG: DUF1289 domain-containing protein, partial [Pseudomonadota bacterium]